LWVDERACYAAPPYAPVPSAGSNFDGAMHMEAGDAVIDQVRVTLDDDEVSGRRTRAKAAGRRLAEPLFRRFAIPKEWRLKDNESGG
jgi:hypothetical protein